MQVNGAYGAPPMYGPQQGGMPQPVTYQPTSYPAYGADQYRPSNSYGAPPTQPQKPEYQYVSSQDVAFGIAGAAAGFAIFGPWGLLAGAALLLISAIVRGIKHASAKKKAQQPPPNQMPSPAPNFPNNQYQYPTYQNQYDYGQNQQYMNPQQQYQYRR